MSKSWLIKDFVRFLIDMTYCVFKVQISPLLYIIFQLTKIVFFTLNTSLNFQKLHNFSKIVDIFLNVSTLHMRILAILSGTSWWSNHLSATPNKEHAQRGLQGKPYWQKVVPRTVLFTATVNEFQQGIINHWIIRPMWYPDTILALDPTPSLIKGEALV